MPKDEFDFDDPLELNGVALCTEADTSRDMADCFVEEFMRMGYSHKQILALFRNPHYLGMNMVLQNKGEPFVRDIIADVFARWGRTIQWQVGATETLTPALSLSERERENGRQSLCDGGASAIAAVEVESRAGDCNARAEESENVRRLFPLPRGGGEGQGEGADREQTVQLDPRFTDPMGNPIPNVE